MLPIVAVVQSADPVMWWLNSQENDKMSAKSVGSSVSIDACVHAIEVVHSFLATRSWFAAVSTRTTGITRLMQLCGAELVEQSEQLAEAGDVDASMARASRAEKLKEEHDQTLVTLTVDTLLFSQQHSSVNSCSQLNVHRPKSRVWCLHVHIVDHVHIEEK
jgi:hypothetical protein